jgi:hypothetical protein
MYQPGKESVPATARPDLLTGHYRFVHLLIAQALGQFRLGSGRLHFLQAP